MTNQQRSLVEALLKQGRRDTRAIAAEAGVSEGSVRAVKAILTIRRRAAAREAGTDPVSATDPAVVESPEVEVPVELPYVEPVRRSGDEPFHRAGASTGTTLIDFWRWCDSDLASNAVRGRLAEYLVALDFGVADGIRREWIAYDLTLPEGITVEVKSAAYLQTWRQRRESSIAFDIRPTLGWTPDTAQFGSSRKRQADAYVFALLEHRVRETLDPLDVTQWRFHVLATRVLDARHPTQKTLTLGRLLRLGPVVAAHGSIAQAVRTAVAAADSR